MTIVESKELVVTKIVDLVRNNPKISQKDVVSLVLNAIESDSEEDKTLILQVLNNLVQNKVLKRINIGRKVTYSFNDFTDESIETEENEEEKINTKKVKQDVNKFILKSLIDGSINKVHLIENTLNELGITDSDKIDTSTESKYTLYKGIIGTVLAELNKSEKIVVSGSKNKQMVSLFNKEEKEVKKTSNKKEVKKPTKTVKKEVNEKKVNEDFIESVVDTYDTKISDTLVGKVPSFTFAFSYIVEPSTAIPYGNLKVSTLTSSLYHAIINKRSLFCGTPKYLAFKTS